MARGYSKLNRRSDNRKALIRDLATQLILHGKIETTLIKAKQLRKPVEKLVTYAKKGDLHSLRLAEAILRDLSSEDQTALSKLFKEIGPKYKDRNGGYTRIYRIGHRLGDSCPMAIIEFVLSMKLSADCPQHFFHRRRCCQQNREMVYLE